MSVDREAAAGAGRTGIVVRTALVLGAVLFSLVLLELGCRLVRSGPAGLVHWPNLARERMSNNEEGGVPCAYAYDAELGWTSPAGCRSRGYNVDEDGFRLTPATGALATPPILVTGSSFAKGDEVDDGETWPAYLQDQTGRAVLNAGVSGYSFDQTVLNTERLAARLSPLAIVVGFTPGDIRRSEMVVTWSRPKPYFAPAGEGLVLKNVPVPGRPGEPVSLPWPARLFGRSVLADEIVKRLGIRKGWYFKEVPALPPGTGKTIACRLMPRLAAPGRPVVVLAQYGRAYWTQPQDTRQRESAAVAAVLDCARRAGLVTLDMAGPMGATVEAAGLASVYRSEHHSAAGNRMVADHVREALAQHGLLPSEARR